MALVALTCCVFNAFSEDHQRFFSETIIREGYDPSNVNDFSSAQNVLIPGIPSLAYINITGVEKMPTKKNVNSHAWFEYYDCDGNYFKKRVILNAQGNSSMAWPKKNFAADFCEDEWKGDSVTSIKISDWISQDAFHFKAYYIDYFKGVGSVGYELFEKIVADRKNPYSWQRAGVKDVDPDARCFPKGFPCVVYLNDEFYGIFNWSIKKHRSNMGHVKGTPEHIHLDGTIGFWKGTIDWTQFEIRNPKDLYCVNTKEESGFAYVSIDSPEEINSIGGNYVVCDDKPSDWADKDIRDAYGDTPPAYLYRKKKDKWYKLTELNGLSYIPYDGDNPVELIDETMPYFDAKNKKHTNTAKVKHYIEALSMYDKELTSLKNSKVSSAEIKKEISKRYDVDGIIDYMCFSLVVSNLDGFYKNWQWFTYDGVKWFVTPYDLDCTFGNYFTGNLLYPAEWTTTTTSYKMPLTQGPCYWIKQYYLEELKARYKELRENGVLTVDGMYSMIEEWYNRVGKEYYSLEYSKWNECPCNSETVCNPNWTTTDDWTGYSAIPAYDDNTTYYEGDKCTMSYRIWIATGTTSGVKPYAKIGHTDNLSRIKYWIGRRLELEDSYMSYIEPAQESYNLVVSSVGKATVCVPFSFEIPKGVELYSFTGVDKNGYLKMKRVNKTVAHKPYYVVGTPGTYTISGEYESGDDEFKDSYMSNGLMYGTYSTIYVPKGGYVLQNNKGVVGFYCVSKDNYITLGANKAYLEIPALNSVRLRSASLYEDNDEATGIVIESKIRHLRQEQFILYRETKLENL